MYYDVVNETDVRTCLVNLLNSFISRCNVTSDLKIMMNQNMSHYARFGVH